MSNNTISQLLQNISQNITDNIERSNATTLVEDTTINDAITTLIDGYGHGEPDEINVSIKNSDGTIFQSYTNQDFNALQNYPTLTETVPHCEFVGWNISLQEAKNYLNENGTVSVYPKYRPIEDKTYVDVTLSEHTLSIQVGVNIYGSYTIDWGDNTPTTTVSTQSTGDTHNLKHTTWWSPTHTYTSSGEYTISIVANPTTETYATFVGLRYSPIDVAPLGEKVEHNNYVNNIINRIVIGGNITKIGWQGFSACENLTQVILPEGVTEISDNAFFGCKKLKGITLPDSLKVIGNRAFYGCTSMQDIFLSKNIDTIDDYAFAYCNGINNFYVHPNNDIISVKGNCVIKQNVELISACNNSTIPNEITSIRPGAFYGLNNISHIDVPTNLKNIGAYAFYRCTSLEEFEAVDSITDIGENAFNGCIKLKSVTLPNNIAYKTVKGNLFKDCVQLQQVSIGTYVNTIKSGVFENCVRLISVNMPNNITDIFVDAFKNCLSLGYQSDEFIVGDYLIKVNFAKDYIIPNNIRLIAREAFKDCEYVTSVKTDNTGSQLRTICTMAFYNCRKLMEVNIFNSSVTMIPNSAFYNCDELSTVIFPNTTTKIDNCAFYNCAKFSKLQFSTSSNESVNISSNITSMGEGNFYNSGITSIKYAPNRTIIPRYMCYGCTNLSTIEIGDGVKTIQEYAFYDCNNVQSITFPASLNSINSSYVFYALNHSLDVIFKGTLSDWCKITFNDLYSNPTGRNTDQISNGKITNLYINDELVENITIPSDVTDLKYCTFYGLYSLKSVTLSENVKSIGNRCFQNCTELSTMNYSGTMSQWNSITKGSSWKSNTKLTQVICSDGAISL